MDNENSYYRVFWDEVLNQLRDQLPPQEYELWFGRVSLVSSDESSITVAVPSQFFRDQVKQRYADRIESLLYDLIGRRIVLAFQIVTPDELPNETAENPSGRNDRTPPEVRADEAKPKPQRAPHPELNQSYTFENFVIGTNNSLAANAAVSISRNPRRVSGYNPLLIYGGVGLGKTHLIQSIGNEIHNNFHDMNVTYVTMETFMNEFIHSIQNKKQHSFKTKYRMSDVLLIDDIHIIQKKPETQEELFHTFNALYDSNRQMVFTCDRPVSEIREITDRLRNRFSRGLNVDLQPPSYETRFAIVKKKIENRQVANPNLSVPDKVIEHICQNIRTNVRDLEAALTKIIAYSELVNREVTMEIAQSQLRDFFSPATAAVHVDVIQRIVADYFSLPTHELRGKKRTKAISYPRQLAMYITRELTELSTTEVGQEFGGRDHTTVMHACQRIESRMRTDPTLEPTVQHLNRRIREASSNG